MKTINKWCVTKTLDGSGFDSQSRFEIFSPFFSIKTVKKFDKRPSQSTNSAKSPFEKKYQVCVHRSDPSGQNRVHKSQT